MPSLIEKLGLDKLSMQDRLTLIDELLQSVATDIEAEPTPEGTTQESDRQRMAPAADSSRAPA